MTITTIERLREHVEEEVTLRGWLYNLRSKGKIHFLILRDGTGLCQCIAFAKELDEDTFAAIGALDQESSLTVTGIVREDARAPGGFELKLTSFTPVGGSPEYPITKKEHGVDFLLSRRHLWVRSRKQHAILRIRAEVFAACQEWLNDQGFVRFDSPILTPCSAEGTSTLFGTPYFDEGIAYLGQTGQLYVEAGMMAFSKVYCFGPSFRAEKSKTRRHLTEFWIVEPEMAFTEHAESLEIQEAMVSAVVRRVLDRRGQELETLERDLEALERITPPFPRIRYDEAIEILAGAGEELGDASAPAWGEDLGAPHETYLSKRYDKPLFITHYPTAIKAFYMRPDPDRPEVARCADLIAPEGYGEIIGGSERISDPVLLEQRIREHGLEVEDYRWYLDLRTFGTVPHSGFGIGIERLVAWITGTRHIRETIPFPRMLGKIEP